MTHQRSTFLVFQIEKLRFQLGKFILRAHGHLRVRLEHRFLENNSVIYSA